MCMYMDTMLEKKYIMYEFNCAQTKALRKGNVKKI